jgi:hypothetical protein
MRLGETCAKWVGIGGAVVTMGLGTVGAASAQSGNQSAWGLRATFVPSWKVPESVTEVGFLQDFIGEGSEVSGGEFSVGVVRGSRFGGDWGLAYFRKSLSDSTRIEIDNGESCASFGAAVQCGPNRDVYTTRGGAFQGVELHKFVPWVTIKRRAQIGMNLGLGAMTVSGGRVTKSSTSTTFQFDPVTRQNVLSTTQSTEELDGKGFLEDLGVPSILPVAKLELAVTGILARNFKVRASGGVNLPGAQVFSVTGIYLFGQ